MSTEIATGFEGVDPKELREKGMGNHSDTKETPQLRRMKKIVDYVFETDSFNVAFPMQYFSVKSSAESSARRITQTSNGERTVQNGGQQVPKLPDGHVLKGHVGEVEDGTYCVYIEVERLSKKGKGN